MNAKDSEFFWDRMAERASETITALKEGRQPSIVRYAVHITNNCNLHCAFCNDNKGGKTMDIGLFRSICQKAGQKGIVHITGGEPLIVPWLQDEIVAQAGATRFALNTNLVVLPRKSVLQSIHRLKTSLDNYEGTGDREHFSDQIVSNIKESTKHVKFSSVCFTATHRNIHRLPKFIQFCQKEFPNLHSMSVSFYKGNNDGFKLTISDVQSAFEYATELDSISRKIFLDTHKPEGNFFPENLTIPCYLSLTERLIDESGQEFFCSHLYRDHVAPPGKPGKELHCVTGCNARFNKFNKYIHGVLTSLRI